MKTYRPPAGALKFVLHAKSKHLTSPHEYATMDKDEAAKAGRPTEPFYVRAGIPNTTSCRCKLSYPVIAASLPPAWQRLVRKARQFDEGNTYVTCECQGRVIE